MPTEFYSHSRDNKREIHFLVQSPELSKQSIPDLTIKSLISNAFEYLDEQTCEKDVLIRITDIKENKVTYEIISEEGNPVHEIALNRFTNETLKDIGKRRIVSKDEVIEEDETKSLLNRFSADEKKGKGILKQVSLILSKFFAGIRSSFEFIDKLLDAISNRSAKLKWDLNFLSEVCGIPPIDGMSMRHALQYMSKMLKRERGETADPILAKRISNAAKLAEDIEEVRNNFSTSKFQSLAEKLKDNVKKLDQEKLLIPVGYVEHGKLHEMLFEISKESSTGKFTISFITGSDDMRNLFDRTMGVENGTQAGRRVISSIEENDLMAALPLFMELQTSSACFDKNDPTSWREIFLQNMKFDRSNIAVVQPEEKVRTGMSPGHLGETISYAKANKPWEEGQRLELSLRLRFFLDICKRNEKGFKNKQFRDQVRTTALHLASSIENEKKIVGAQVIQGQEMTQIYGELKQLIDKLESTLPELIDLQTRIIPVLTGLAEIEPALPTPPLFAVTIEPNVFPDIRPPLLPINKNDPVSSIKNWGERIQKLIASNRIEQAALEAKLMVRMLPNPTDPFWNDLNLKDAQLMIDSFCTLATAIACASSVKEEPSLNDIASVVALNYYGFGICNNIIQNGNRSNNYFTESARQLMEELMDTRLPLQDKLWLQQINGAFPPNSLNQPPGPKDMTPALEGMRILSEMIAVTNQQTSIQNVASNNSVNAPGNPVNASAINQGAAARAAIELIIKGIQQQSSSVSNQQSSSVSNQQSSSVSNPRNQNSAIPIALRAPKYADTLSKEVNNRYLSEFCCLGCIRDNCPNYNDIPKKDHRFHPLYMLHNNVDIFCEGLIKEGKLHRDEISDLMYTQQTNQNANHVWKKVHHEMHGFDYATGFDTNDHQIQLMNTIPLFLDRPQYFKQPELRWHFEMKLFAHDGFAGLLKDKFNEYKPFLVNTLFRLSQEIDISYAAGNKDVTAYLISIADRISSIIDSSRLDQIVKEELKAKLSTKADAVLLKMVKDVVGKEGPRAVEQQQVLLPIFLERYFQKFAADCNHSDFGKDEVLEVIVLALGKLESIETDKDKIDPEIRDRYQTLMQWLHPKIKDLLLKEGNKGDFVNKILMVINPQVAAMRLEWEPNDYPTVLALDGHGEFYQFDLSTGQLTFGKKLQEGLPLIVKKNPEVIKLFGESINENWQRFSPEQAEEGIKAYVHQDFPDYRIFVWKGFGGEESKITIERNIEIEGKEQTLTYVRFNEQNRLMQGQPPSEAPDIPLAVAMAIADRTCWVDSKQESFYVFDTENKEVYAKVGLKKVVEKLPAEEVPKGGPEEVEKIHIKYFRFVGDKVDLLAPKERELENFTSIEKAEFIQVTGRKGHASIVTYPRYELANKGLPISYHLKNGKVTSSSFPGYSLAPVGVRPGSLNTEIGVLPLPRTFDTYQLLIKDGSQKVLIPLCEFGHVYSVRGEQLPLTKAIFTEVFSKQSVYEFSVDSETNRLTAQTGDAYCYLAYLNIAHKDYAAAAFYLEKARTCSGYAGNYQVIVEYMQKWQDESPSGIAIKLKFELFNEKILEDSRQKQIVKGNLKELEAIEFNKANRLSGIAELYQKYLALESLGTEGEGIDPALALSLDDKVYISEKIKELLKEHGDQLIDTGEPEPLRAEQIRLQEFKKGGEVAAFEINRGAFLIWNFAGNSNQTSPLGLQDPRWVLQNFRTLFNQILKYPTTSVEFKELYNRLRMISERAQGKLADEEFQLVQYTQSTLLRLMTMKTKNPNSIKELQKVIGSERLPELKGAFFRSSRVSQILRMEQCYKYLDKFALQVKSQAETKISQMLRKVCWDDDEHDLVGLGKKAYSFIKKFSGNDREFEAAFKPFLLREIYGTEGAESIEKLSAILNILDEAPIQQPTQFLQALPAVPSVPVETYRTRYEGLIKAPDENENEISTLEKKIAARKTPMQNADAGRQVLQKPSVIIGEKQMKDSLERFKIVTKTGAKVAEKLFDELAKDPEPAFVRVAEENRRDLRAYVNERSEVSLDLSQMYELKEELETNLVDAKKSKEELQRNLLQYVDMFKTPAGIIAMRRLVGQGVKPSIEFLIARWRNNEIDKDWENHPFNKLGLKKINKEQLQQLDQEISRYLELSTKIDHLERLVSMGDSYIDSCGNNDFGDDQLASELYDALRTERQFQMDSIDSTEFRDFLFLEYSQKIILRKPQVDTLREMLTDPNAVRQLIMGGGKSKVLLPMLAKRKTTGKNLVMLMLPEELYETNCRDLDNTNRQLFGQEMRRFNFGRSTDMSKEALTEIYRSLLKTINDQGFVMTTKRSMLSFRNAYLDLLYKLQDVKGEGPAATEKREELISQIRAMSKIMNLFNTQTDVIADEVDACLDVRKEVNFSLGKSEMADQLKVALGGEIIQMILAAKKGTPLHELGAALHHNTQAALSPERRKELLKEVARSFYDKNQAEFSKIEREAFVSYIMDDPKGEAVEKLVFEMKESNNLAFKRLTAFKGFMNRGFGTTLGRVGNVNYGRDPVSETWTIPYMASNAPHIGSEFDDDVERICFTYQDYMQNGVSYKQVYQLITRLFNRAQEELRAKPHIPGQFFDLNDTQAAKEFNEFIKDFGLGAISLSTVATPKRIEALSSAINRNAAGKLWFCQHYVLNNMEQFSSQINASSADLVEMVDHFAGFTGTPWNLHTYHDKIHAEKSIGVDGKTWALMLGREVPIHTFNFDADKPIDSLLNQIEVVGNYQAVIDTGAYLRGTNNCDFVDKCFEKAAANGIALEAGIYFDESGRIVKKTEIEGSSLPIEIAADTNKMKGITLYDQAHTVGADIKQGKKAKAIVTIGENTFIRDLFQAVWRLRQLHQDQKVSFAVSSQIRNRILNGESRELTTEDILKFCLRNEANREGDDNYRAEKEKINGYARRAAIPKIAELIANGIDSQQIVHLAANLVSESAGLYVKERAGENAFDQYGKMKLKKAPDTLLKTMKENAEKKCDEVAEVFKKVNDSASTFFTQQAQNVANRQNPPKDWFPKEVDSSSSETGEVEQEAQAEVEQELELMIETQTQVQVQVEVETIVPKVDSGEAGHGEVVPMAVETLSSVIDTHKCADLMYPHGDRVGDKVVFKEMSPIKGLIRKLSVAAPIFDDNVFLSAVFERNLPMEAGKNVLPPQVIFYSNRKPVKNVLIAKKNNLWTMVIPTVHEAQNACREYIHGEGKEGQAVLVTISPNSPMVMYKTGDDRTGALPFTDENDRKEFYRLYVQAKLFNGEIDFNTEGEKEALKNWLIQRGPVEFKSYFEKNILPSKPKRFRDGYSKSSLSKIMKELIPQAA